MEIIVTYNSKTGFTKKYAQWIAEELNCPIFEATKIKKSELQYTSCKNFTIIFCIKDRIWVNQTNFPLQTPKTMV